MAAHEPGDVHTQFFDAFNAKDVETLASLYEPDALLVMPGGGTLAGIDAISKALEMGVGSGRTFRHESQVVHQTGDIAVLDCKSTVMDMAADGTVTSHEGNSIEIVRRQPDGTWRFVIDVPGR
jgi:uncharacterized protein (TIGR02246 family)